MDRFRRELENFVREVYEGERKVLVFGEGPLRARVMLVGEAPGEREALEGVRDRWLRLVNGEDASVTENR